MTLLVCRALPGQVLVMLLKLFEYLNIGAKQVLRQLVGRIAPLVEISIVHHVHRLFFWKS